MNGEIDHILDACWVQLESGEASLEDCLARYPHHAGILGPLLLTALEVRRLRQPETTPEAFEAGKQLMLAALARKQRRQIISPAPSFDAVRQAVSQLREGRGLTAWLTRPAVISALAVVTVFVWVIASGLFFQLWRSGLVPRDAVLANVTGLVEVQAAPGVAWQPVTTGGHVEAGDRIRTGESSGVTLSFLDGSTTSLGSETEIAISELSSQRDGQRTMTVLYQRVGQTRNRVESKSAPGSRFQIETASAVAVAQGTEFMVDVGADDTTHVTVMDGMVTVTARQSTVVLSAGQATTVQPDQAPGPAVPAPTVESSEPPVPTATASAMATATGSAIATTTATGTSTHTSTSVPSATARPSHTAIPTSTATATATPTRTSTPGEVVEIFMARYRENQKELDVKARTTRPECALRLVGFGPMVREGEHWEYTQGNVGPDDVPSTVTVVSTCGGSDTGPVQWD